MPDVNVLDVLPRDCSVIGRETPDSRLKTTEVGESSIPVYHVRNPIIEHGSISQENIVVGLMKCNYRSHIVHRPRVGQIYGQCIVHSILSVKNGAA